MNQARQDNLFAETKFRTLWLLVTVGLCLTSWMYFGLRLSRQWNAMSLYAHLMTIVFLLAYPLPCVHLFKKEPNPFLIAMVAYVLLNTIGIIMFPLTS